MTDTSSEDELVEKVCAEVWRGGYITNGRRALVSFVITLVKPALVNKGKQAVLAELFKEAEDIRDYFTNAGMGDDYLLNFESLAIRFRNYATEHGITLEDK